MSKLNEFAMNLPMTSVTGSVVDITASQTVPVDVSPAHDHISVYVDSAQVADYDPAKPTIIVDLVLNVAISNPGVSGATTNYKMVKRLSLDKVKLACDAENLTPVQVVEDEEDDPLEVARIMNEFYAARRAKELCGLSESAGKKTAKVLFKYEDSDKNLASSTIDIKHIRDAAHARHVFDVKHAHKYPNAKITRVTLQD